MDVKNGLFIFSRGDRRSVPKLPKSTGVGYAPVLGDVISEQIDKGRALSAQIRDEDGPKKLLESVERETTVLYNLGKNVMVAYARSESAALEQQFDVDIDIDIE